MLSIMVHNDIIRNSEISKFREIMMGYKGSVII